MALSKATVSLLTQQTLFSEWIDGSDIQPRYTADTVYSYFVFIFNFLEHFKDTCVSPRIALWTFSKSTG